jgi:hypothetical protein
VRIRVEKQFRGDLEGTSMGQMLIAGTDIKDSAGYVAIERVIGTLTGAPDSELQQHLGENVTLHGQFSLYGKIGPFILVAGRPIYLVSHGLFSWGESYMEMAGTAFSPTSTLLPAASSGFTATSQTVCVLASWVTSRYL